MALRLFNHALSTSCYKVRLLLGFLELDYQSIPVGFYPDREHRSPEFLELNPLGEIPVLEDADVRLRDSQAILCYLARRYDDTHRWLPEEPGAYGQVMMWLFFAACRMAPATAARLHDALGYDLDADAARRDARSAFRILDDHMSERRIGGGTWIVGERPTIADIACFAPVALSGDGGIGHEDYPALRNWMLAFRRLPGFAAMPGIPEFA